MTRYVTPALLFTAAQRGFESPPALIAQARKNGAFGYKAVVLYPTHTYQPVRKNFKTREDALAYAQKWIAANHKS